MKTTVITDVQLGQLERAAQTVLRIVQAIREDRRSNKQPARLDAKLTGTLGARIVAARKRLGLNQVDFARRAAIAPAQLCKIELDRINTTVDTLDRIARALGVKPSALID